MDNILRLAKETLPYAVELRRYFHVHPELSDKEDGTVARVTAELAAAGIPFIDVPHGGVLGFIGKGDGPTVLLRADMDALPIQESETLSTGPRECRSQHDGVMHACGHDAHTAALVGAGRILKGMEDTLSGKVILAFERGEEGSFRNLQILLGYMIKNDIRFDTCFGLHVAPGLPVGQVAIGPGPINAGSIPIHFAIKGRGGHGSRPDLAASPVDCMMAIGRELGDVRMKYISPFEQLSMSIGIMRAGTAANIIPETAEIQGTARYYSEENAGKPFRAQMERIARTCGEMYGCTVENKTRPGPFPVVNEATCAALAARSIAGALGQEAVIPQTPSMGSESFGLFMLLAPGCYGSLGIHNPDKGTGGGIHTPQFALDEEALAYGMSAHVAYALGYMKERPAIPFAAYVGTMEEL